MDDVSPIATDRIATDRAMPGGRAARRHLRAADEDLAILIQRVGPAGLRVETSRQPFESLVRAIAHQQLHAKAAEAMLGRLIARFEGGFPTPVMLLGLGDEQYRACGFSGGKTAAMRAVAEASLAGIVPSRRQAQGLSDAALVARLVPLRGIGVWTVEMLLIFSLGRPDVMPIDDFGVREGYRRIKRLDAQPRPRALAEATAHWRPYRSFAAWYLWRAADEAKIRPAAASLETSRTA